MSLKFHLVAIATTVFDETEFWEQFLKRTSQGTFLPNLVEIGHMVLEMILELFTMEQTQGDPKSSP